MKSLFSRLMAGHLVVILITLLTLGVASSYLLEHYFHRAKERELATKANILAAQIQGLFSHEPHALDGAAPWVGLFERFTDTQVWVTDFDGLILMGNAESEQWQGQRLDDPELLSLLEGETVSRRGNHPNFERPMLSVAVPVMVDDIIRGAIFLHTPLVGVNSTVAGVRRMLVYAGLWAIGLAVLVSGFLSRQVSRPLHHMTRVARKMSAGHFNVRVQDDTTEEISQLASAFNHLATDLDRSLKEQKRLEDMRKTFVTNVSHELRTPLTSIRGFLEAIIDGLPESDRERDEYLRIALEETTRLQRLADGLVGLSRLESGRTQLRPEPVKLRDAVVQAISRLAPQMRHKKLRLTNEIPVSLPPAAADPDRLQQILINLLDNAMRFSPPRSTIHIRAELNEDELTFALRDEGPGIPADELPQIWERFYKVDKARRGSGGGSGLGLVIVKELVEQHGGHVFVKSVPGQGATFGFTLPRAG